MQTRLNDGQKLIPLSALQHYAYCPRQCALIHNEQAWAENWFTAKGKILHQRVDRGEPETRKGIRFERAVLVEAPTLGLTGKLDLLEIDRAQQKYKPVEYKSGKPKSELWDKIQVCAQALCLEEMLSISIDEGALWYWQTRRAEVVPMTAALRTSTQQAIEDVRRLFDLLETPTQVAAPERCRACSLNELCQPELIRSDRSQGYWDAIFTS